jgi:tetratricopeptide (TPR) repeat protein
MPAASPAPSSSPSEVHLPPSPRARAIGILLVLAVAAVFGRVVGHELLSWDDVVNTLGNPHLNPPSAAGTLFFWRHAYMDLYVPVTYTLWALLLRITREPWIFHAASLVLHAGAALAAFGLLRRLVRDDRAAGAGALLFALHPVQVEAVGWMSGTKDVLAALFGLLALARYVDHARDSRVGARWSRDWALAFLFTLLALLSKPAAVAVPLLAAVLDLGLLRRRARDAARDLAPFFALAIAWIFVTRAVQPAAGVAVPPVLQRLLVALDALAFYAGKLLWPVSLALDYGRDPAWLLEHGRPFLTSLVPLAAAAALVLAAAKRPGPLSRPALVAALLFVAGVAPVLGLVPFDFQRYSTVADHYLYLSMIGPALLLAAALRERPGRVPWLAAGALLAGLAVRSAVQIGVWKDDPTLYRHVLAVNPRSWSAHGNLGVALAARGDAPGAIAEYEKALAIQPADARTQTNLGTALDELDRTDEALPHLEEAVRLEPGDRTARENLAIALLRRDRPQEAETHLRAALRIQPDSFLAHYYLAGALDRLGKTGEVIGHLEEAVRLNPRFEPARADLAAVREARGEDAPR